jgi:DNA gyrase subunit A
MVVADENATLFTACENGYGKRTYFGPNDTSLGVGGPSDADNGDEADATDEVKMESAKAQQAQPDASGVDEGKEAAGEESAGDTESTGDTEDSLSSASRYRTQRRGGKGLRDIKTTERNGKVIGIQRVSDDDELLMMTIRGKIQRIAARDANVIGRNTQGVRIMSLDEDDKLAAIVRVPKEDAEGAVPPA